MIEKLADITEGMKFASDRIKLPCVREICRLSRRKPSSGIMETRYFINYAVREDCF